MNTQVIDDDIFKGYGVRVKLKTDFTKIREALTRIGIANYRTKNLTQSCHIFHKKGNYALMHFKEMFLFDGKDAHFTTEDESRRNKIVMILKSWDMIEIDEEIDEEDFPIAAHNAVNIISRDQKHTEEWTLTRKYTLGKRKFVNTD